jgi:hypothetical protein
MVFLKRAASDTGRDDEQSQQVGRAAESGM